MMQCIVWDRETLRPKHHLDQGWSALRSSTSFSSNAHMGWLRVLDEWSAAHDPRWIEMLRAASCDMILASGNHPFLKRLYAEKKVDIERVSTLCGTPIGHWRIVDPLPRIWLVTQADLQVETSDVDKRTVDEWATRIRTAWLDSGRCEYFLQRVTIHLPSTGGAAATSGRKTRPQPHPPMSDEQACRCTSESGSQRRYEVQMKTDGWLVLNDAYAPGWRARITDEQGTTVENTVYRANDWMMAISVGPGKQQVELTYEPLESFWGLVGSALTIALLVAWAIADLTYRLRPSAGCS